MKIIQLITLSLSLLLVEKAIAQGTKISVFKNQNESVDLVVYNSPVNCRKNFAVDIAFSYGLRNTNEWLVWTMNYKDCNQAVKQLQMSTPIGKECNRSSEFLSILQSGASSHINGEHTIVEPQTEFSDIDVIMGISDVRTVMNYQAQTDNSANAYESSKQRYLDELCTSWEDENNFEKDFPGLENDMAKDFTDFIYRRNRFTQFKDDKSYRVGDPVQRALKKYAQCPKKHDDYVSQNITHKSPWLRDYVNYEVIWGQRGYIPIYDAWKSTLGLRK